MKETSWLLQGTPVTVVVNEKMLFRYRKSIAEYTRRLLGAGNLYGQVAWKAALLKQNPRRNNVLTNGKSVQKKAPSRAQTKSGTDSSPKGFV